MTAPNFRFVDDINVKNATQKEKELERAAQRAHAARISHRWRKEKAKEKKRARSSDSSSPVNQEFVSSALVLRSSPEARSSLNPFDSLGLQITPDVHRIVIFVAEVYTPSIYIPNFFRPNWTYLVQFSSTRPDSEQSNFRVNSCSASNRKRLQLSRGSTSLDLR